MAELEAVAQKEGVRLFHVGAYVQPIAYFRADNLQGLAGLNRMCNQLSQAVLFGQVISMGADPDDAPCGGAGERLDALVR